MRQPPDTGHDLLHGRTGGNNTARIINHVLLAPQIIDFIFQTAIFKGLVNGKAQFLGHNRLGDIIGSSGFNGLYDQRRFVQRSANNNGSLRGQLMQGLDDIFQIGILIAEIEDHRAEGFFFHLHGGIQDIRGGTDMTIGCQGLDYPAGPVFSIADNDDAR